MTETPSAEILLQQMLGNSPQDLDQREGSPTFDLLAPVAIMGAELYVQAEHQFQRKFATYAYEEALDLVCYDLGLSRNPAKPSTGMVKLMGPEGTAVDVKTVVSTASGLAFETTEPVVIPEQREIEVHVVSLEKGRHTRAAAGEISYVEGPLSGLLKCTNLLSLEGGTDQESDESLRERYWLRARRPTTSGNIHHYREWALEVPGVGDAKIIPVWNGPQTVKVIVVDQAYQSPTPALVEGVQAHIEEVAPIGSIVTVTGAQKVAVRVAARVVLIPGASIEEVTQTFTKALRKYVNFKETIIRYHRISALLSTVPEVVDFSDLTLNEGQSSLALGFDEVAEITEVVLDV